MNANVELPYLKCTGCGVCSIVCPCNAITMIERTPYSYHDTTLLNESDMPDYFEYPSIDEKKCIGCKKCLNQCPAINIRNDNLLDPQCFSVQCESFVNKCSSGGVFGQLASIFLNNGDFVVGAKYDGFELEEVVINDLNKLEPLLQSKYIQSSTPDIYPKIKTILETGKKVLFCATPCQIAALYSIIGDNAFNLYTIDLVCRGTTSSNLLKRYIKEETSKPVKTIEFRNKKYGWGLNTLIKYEDGTSELRKKKEDTFTRIFQSWCSLRNSCYLCPFNKLPRQGDLSIGDYWGIDPSINDKRGTSIVLINNQKGKELLSLIEHHSKSSTITVKQAAVKNVAVTTHTVKPSGYAIFNTKCRSQTLYNSINTVHPIVKEIGLVVMSNRNYGNNLTNWSLYHTIKKMGHSVKFIARGFPDKISPMFENEPYDRTETSKPPLFDINKQCKMFIVGCDQTFAPMGVKNDKITLLPWVRGDRYMMSYAASLGKNNYPATDDYKNEMSFLLKRFDALSVRESSAPILMKDEFGVDSEYVVDPVFLTDKDEYIQLAKNGKYKPPKEKYIHCYILDPTKDKISYIKEQAKKLDIHKITCILNKGSTMTIEGFDVVKASIEDYLNLLNESYMFFTDSFHGMAFATILRKNFYALSIKPSRGEERVRSYLTDTGLMHRWVKNSNPDYSDIDYELVYKKLNVEIKRSKEWLQNHILEGLSKKKFITSYDYSMINIDMIKKGDTASDFCISLKYNEDCASSNVFEPSMCLKFARSFRDGYCIGNNDLQTIQWYRRSILSNNKEAVIELFDYLYNKKDPKYYNEMIQLVRMARDLDSPASYLRLAWIYHHGIGTKIDLKRSKHFAECAYQRRVRGSAEECKQLNELIENQKEF